MWFIRRFGMLIEKLEEVALQWYVLHVRSRHEIVTDDELRKKGIKTYLPLARKLRQWKDRRKLVDFPLFPGYLFVNIRPASPDHFKVLKTKGAVAFITSAMGTPVPVPPEEIDSLRLLVESGEELDVYPSLKEGAGVKIVKGFLKGAEGILDKKEEYCIFSVNVIILGRSISVKVLADDIECMDI